MANRSQHVFSEPPARGTWRVSARRALIEAYERRLQRRPTFRYLEQLERSQWFPLDAIRWEQRDALVRLLRHAERTCPYYRELWAPLGLQARQVESVADLQNWPVTSRDDINEHRAAMCSQDAGPLRSKSTGGSSAVPLHFFMNDDSVHRRMAAWHRGYGWAGAGPGTSQWYFWGIPLGDRPLRASIKDRLYHRIYNRRVINSFDYSDERVPALAAQLRASAPDVIVAYVNPLYEFARALDERDIKPYSPRAILVGAEKLHAFQRVLISRVFRAPVFETYGSREFMLIGAECEQHSGFHTMAEHLIVEVVDAAGRPCAEGVEGNILVTDLFNYGMPFIRYRIGDRGRMSSAPCACGRSLPRLTAVSGRKLDVIRTRDRKMVPGEFFRHLLKDFPAIRRFQVVQRTLDGIDIAVMATGAWNAEAHGKLTALIQRTLGTSCAVNIRQVDDIPLTAAGQHRVVVSELTGV
jgi:phenylacetate-coenzyme A ligase PaaK-like adenylate-forming protein